MTRKDYIKLAEIVNNGFEFKKTIGENPPPELYMDMLANLCAADNPNFNRQRFIDACQKED